MRRFALPLALVAAMVVDAAANGRPPATSTLHFRQGHEQDIIAGMTFGALVSHDGGATWHWTCEKAIGYGGLYDPRYEYTSSGAIFATTFTGLKVNRDGCTYTPAPQGTTFVSTIALGPTGTVYAAAADPADVRICKSTDDGMTFPTCAMPGMLDDSWSSIVVAPSDPLRVYVSGFRFVKKCNAASTNAGMTCTTNADCMGTNAMCETQKVLLFFKSTDGGATYTAMATTGLTYVTSSIVTFYADPNTATTLYARVTLELNNQGDGLFMSTNSGTSWTKIDEKVEGISFVARKNGQLVVATQASGSEVSTNGGQSWTPLASPPHVNCLYENAAQEVWACTQNYGMPGVDSDGYGIMKSTDLATCTGVLKFQDIKGPIACAPGTTQADECVGSSMGMPSVWCCLEDQLGISSTEPPDCTMPPLKCQAPDGPAPDDSTTTMVKPPKGCCDTGDGASGAFVLSLGIGVMLMRRRRTR